jgi:hypothetical protein
MGTEPFGLQAGLRPYLCKRRISPAKAPYFKDSGISVVSSTPMKMGRKSCIFSTGDVARLHEGFVHFLFAPLRKNISRQGVKVALDSRNNDQSPVDKLVTGR